MAWDSGRLISPMLKFGTSGRGLKMSHPSPDSDPDPDPEPDLDPDLVLQGAEGEVTDVGDS